MSTGELIFLFVLGLIVFGPKRLPEIGKQVAKVLGELKRASNEFKSQLESEINALDVQESKTARPAMRDAAKDNTAKPLEMPQLAVPPSQMNEEQIEAARQEFMAKNYGLTPPQPAPVSTTVLEKPATAEPEHPADTGGTRES